MKRHYFISREPVRFGHSARMLCGCVVVEPIPDAPLEVGKIADLPERNMLTDCKHCWEVVRAELQAVKEVLYLYGIWSGQKIRQFEDHDV